MSLRRRTPPFDRILVAIDFSKASMHALARARRLPIGAGGKVSIVHVLPDGLPKRARAAAEKAAHAKLLQAARDFLEGDPSPGGSDVTVSPVLATGRAHAAIVREAAAARAELIVLGRHGDRPLKDLFLGSSAERVLRTSPASVLVVSGRATRAYSRPVVAADLETDASALVETALRVLPLELRTAILVHAFHAPFQGFVAPAAHSGALTDLARAYQKEADRGLRDLVQSLRPSGIDFEAALRRGDPRSVILDEAARRHADLVAVGTHGRSGLAHALLGSVAEWVIRSADCDVLVARRASGARKKRR